MAKGRKIDNTKYRCETEKSYKLMLRMQKSIILEKHFIRFFKS